MADAKITALTALTGANLADGDMFVVVDVSDTTMAASGTDKNITSVDLFTYINGRVQVAGGSVSTPAAGFASDTYLAGSGLAIPNGRLKAQTIYRCAFDVSKTGAGTATPIINVRIGTAGTTADTSRATLTFAAQTAVADAGMFEIAVIFRTVGSGTSAVIQARGILQHALSITGLSTDVSGVKVATSSGFDSTTNGSIIGLSVNGGTSAAWTITLVEAELLNLG